MPPVFGKEKGNGLKHSFLRSVFIFAKELKHFLQKIACIK
jgi:hypothetical protein